MDKTDFQKHLLDAYNSDSLLTPKHDPNNLPITWDRPRSVLSLDLAQNLESFIGEGEFSVIEYENLDYPSSPKYWEIIPEPSSSFTIPGSGVKACDPDPSVAYDRLVAVSGSFQGLHLFAEDSEKIQNRLSSGKLKLNGPL